MENRHGKKAYPVMERNGYISSAKPSKSRGKDERTPSCFGRLSNTIITYMETAFYRYGRLIGEYPWVTIFLSIFVVGLMCIGFLRFEETTDQYKLWVPAGAKVVKDREWVDKNFPAKTRFVTVIMVGENMLQPSSVRALKTFYDKSMELTTPNGHNLSTLCISTATPVGDACRVSSLLELWTYNDTVIEGLTESDIKDMVNTVEKSPMYFNAYDVTNVLGEYTKSGNDITAARATAMTWILQGGADVKKNSEELETKLINFAQEKHSGIDETYVYASRTFLDEGAGSIQNDLQLLSLGYAVVIIFIIIVLGRFNLVEQRIGLSLCGLMCIGLSIAFAIGLGSAAGWEYGPIHSILPFLLLGIGVDDMFVIVGTLNNLSPQERTLHIPEKIGRTLRHAGVSVSVTSFTDIVAFGIGATTVLPGLKSFCIYAALGITAIFLLQTTLFTAGLSLDLKRSSTDRDACICFYKHKDYKSNDCSQRDLARTFFKKYFGPLLMKLPVKICVTIAVLGLLGANIYGVINLKQESDPSWFFSPDSYARKYLAAKDRYFPDDGTASAGYCGQINYLENRLKLDQFYQDLTRHRYTYTGSVESPFWSFTVWLNSSTNTDVTNLLDSDKVPVDEAAYNTLLYHFTRQEQDGKRYSSYINVDTNKTITSAKILSFKHKDEVSVSDDIKSMDAIKEVLVSVGLPSAHCFVYGARYTSLETNKIIQNELYKNLGLAAGAVFLVTLLLIAHIWTSLLVFSCVVLTLVDVMGCMYFWGLTVDTVASVILILAIGLAVDYSAHVGHTFMTITGIRSDRVKSTLTDIGPPVFSGGFSTFLAFILLATSESYVFITFFKIFFLVVIFGVFHGLMYLPVILSWVGPAPYLSAERRSDEIEHLHPGHTIESKHGHDNHVFHTNTDWKGAVVVPESHIGSPDASPPVIPLPDYEHLHIGLPRFHLHHHHDDHQGNIHNNHHGHHGRKQHNPVHEHGHRASHYHNNHHSKQDRLSHDEEFDDVLKGVEIYRGSRHIRH